MGRLEHAVHLEVPGARLDPFERDSRHRGVALDRTAGELGVAGSDAPRRRAARGHGDRERRSARVEDERCVHDAGCRGLDGLEGRVRQEIRGLLLRAEGECHEAQVVDEQTAHLTADEQLDLDLLLIDRGVELEDDWHPPRVDMGQRDRCLACDELHGDGDGLGVERTDPRDEPIAALRLDGDGRPERWAGRAGRRSADLDRGSAVVDRADRRLHRHARSRSERPVVDACLHGRDAREREGPLGTFFGDRSRGCCGAGVGAAAEQQCTDDSEREEGPRLHPSRLIGAGAFTGDGTRVSHPHHLNLDRGIPRISRRPLARAPRGSSSTESRCRP